MAAAEMSGCTSEAMTHLPNNSVLTCFYTVYGADMKVGEALSAITPVIHKVFFDFTKMHP